MDGDGHSYADSIIRGGISRDDNMEWEVFALCSWCFSWLTTQDVGCSICEFLYLGWFHMTLEDVQCLGFLQLVQVVLSIAWGAGWRCLFAAFSSLLNGYTDREKKFCCGLLMDAATLIAVIIDRHRWFSRTRLSRTFCDKHHLRIPSLSTLSSDTESSDSRPTSKDNLLMLIWGMSSILLGEANWGTGISPFWRSQSASRIFLLFCKFEGFWGLGYCRFFPCGCQVHKSLSTSMMESKIRKHEVKIPPSMMSNPLVNAANLGPSLRAGFPLMPNDLTGVPGLCEKTIENRKPDWDSEMCLKTVPQLSSPRCVCKRSVFLGWMYFPIGVPRQ